MRKLVCMALIIFLMSLPALPGNAAENRPAPGRQLMATDAGNYYLITSPNGRSLDVYHAQSQKLLYSVAFADIISDFSAISALALDDASLTAACVIIKSNASAAIYLFDLQNQKLSGVIGGFTSKPTRIAFSDSGRYLAVGTDRQGLIIYQILQIKKAASSAVSLSSEERTSLEKRGYLEKEMLVPSLMLHDASIQSKVNDLSFDNKTNLAVATEDGRIRLYDQTFKLIRNIQTKNGDQPSQVRFSPDASRLAVSYAGKSAIDVYAASNFSYLYSPSTSGMGTATVSNVAWSPDGRFLYAAGSAGPKDETALYKWRRGGEGSWSHLGTVNSDSRIVPALGGGLLSSDAGGLNLLDKRYGTIYNERGAVWAALEYKHGHVTYEIGGDYSDSNGASGSYWFPISRLKWPINAIMAEVGGEIHLGRRFELRGSVSHNITSNLGGKMEDSDWLYDPAIYGDSTDIYSESDTNFRGYTFDGQARFWIMDRHYANNSSLSLGLGAGFTYQNYHWEAHDGYQSSWIPQYDVGPLPGLLCTYNAQLYMPYIELALKSRVGKVDISGTIGGSPYLWAKDEDDHVLRKKLMTTSAHGYSLKGGFQAHYNFTDYFFTGLHFNLLYYQAKGTQKGIQYATSAGEPPVGYQWDIEHEIKSFQWDSLLVAGFRF